MCAPVVIRLLAALTSRHPILLGYDSAELVSGLRAKHYEGLHTWGLEMNTGTLADMTELGICEAFKVKSQV